MNDDAMRNLIGRAEAGDAHAQYQLALLMLDDNSSTDDRCWDVDSAYGKELEHGCRWLIVAARNGSVEAQTDLAKRYFYGIDFPENQDRAFEWFSKAANKNCAEAQFFLGEIFTGDEIVAYDIETALKWYEQSAQSGFKWSQLALFDIYRNGADLSVPDVEKSLFWGRKAGEQGSVVAQLTLGRMFFEGDLVERNPVEAAFWLHLAADRDDESKQLLAVLYLHGQGVEKNIAKSAELLRSLARKGDTDAMVQLAIVLSEMFRPPHDEIHSWLIQAAELGNRQAREILEDVEGAERAPQAVQEEFKTAIGPQRTASQWRALAEAGDREGQFCLARLLEDGEDVQGDYEEAVHWFMRAADQGHTGAQWHLSACYRSGLGLEPDQSKALELLTRAARGGNSDAQLQLGLQYYFGVEVPEDKRKAFQCFKNASEQWNLNALVWQGDCYHHGAGVVSDRRKACELYRKAADLGIVRAQYKLGMMYSLGWGVRQSCEEAARWLILAAQRNHSGAQVELGRMHLTGDGVAESQYQAELLFRQAADLGDAEGKFELGRLLILNDDTEFDLALRHLGEAAEEDHLEAQLFLGSLFEQGHGERLPNFKQSAKWYHRAANAGDRDAKLKLTSLLSRETFLSDVLDELIQSERLDHDVRIANRYLVVDLVLEDCSGIVYKARDLFTELLVTVKLLHHEKRDGAQIAAFLREAKSISRVNHANLLRLHDFGVVDGGTPYVVFDFVGGASLDSILKKDGPLDLERCISLFVGLIEGLAAAHDAGVVHRDLKPENIILVDARTSKETAKVIQFGVTTPSTGSDAETRRLTLTANVAGIFSYFSPEQCHGQALDSRSDIYSLGCVLFEALTGKRAIKGSSYVDVMCNHFGDHPASIIEARPEAGFSSELDAMVRKMMATDPLWRYQDLITLRDELIGLLTTAA
ncbi:MAG: protein kinase [Candidatus Melainabacteria bacterium]|nr:protein kinase [Candidatus Melainabacteria bacterium]